MIGGLIKAGMSLLGGLGGGKKSKKSDNHQPNNNGGTTIIAQKGSTINLNGQNLNSPKQDSYGSSSTQMASNPTRTMSGTTQPKATQTNSQTGGQRIVIELGTQSGSTGINTGNTMSAYA